MNKIYTLIVAGMLLLAGKAVQAQSFVVQHDTLTSSTGGYEEIINGINNLTTANLPIQWKIVAHNFPADWQTYTGFCDNANCYTGSVVCSGTTYTDTLIPGLNSFQMQINHLLTTTPGVYYIKVRINNALVPTDTAMETFVISKIPSAVPTVKGDNEMQLYPNPATSSVNLVYDASLDVKTIAVYNIIGRVTTVYRPTGNNGANLNLENTPSGVYFVRLMNSRGDIVATRKFTKQ